MNNGFKGKLSMNMQKCLEVANNIEKSWITDFRSLIDMRDMGDIRDIWYLIYEICDIWEIKHMRDQNMRYQTYKRLKMCKPVHFRNYLRGHIK